jgi:hypothetical protein
MLSYDPSTSYLYLTIISKKTRNIEFVQSRNLIAFSSLINSSTYTYNPKIQKPLIPERLLRTGRDSNPRPPP